MVYNTALGMVQNTEDAQDITQEVFVKAFKALKGFRNEALLKTWLYRITINTCIDQLRKMKTKDMYEEPGNFADFNHPGVLYENREKAAILFKAISRLPEKQKAAFILQKTEGCAVSEVAEIMNISVQATESLLARAKENLRKNLSDYYEEFRS